MNLDAGRTYANHSHAPEFFTFWPFFRKFLSNRPLAERIPEMDPWLGARVSGAELGATVTGAELLATGQTACKGLGARADGAELDAVDLGAELGATHSGAELPAFNPRPAFFPERSSSSFSSGFFLATSSYLTNRHIGP